SANKGTSIYGRCWCREHITFWDLLGKIVIYGAGDRGLPSEEEKTPRNERWWRSRENSRDCYIGCGGVGRVSKRCAIGRRSCTQRRREKVCTRTAELDRRVQVTATSA